MSPGELRLQPMTRRRLATLGEAGRVWTAGLPRTLDELAGRWGLTYGRPVAGGSGSYVVRATTVDGRAVVVKVAVSDDGLAAQVAALRRAQGRGYVGLLGHDPERNALLLEELGLPVSRRGWAPERQLEVVADTLAYAWMDPAGVRPDVGQDKASLLAATLRTDWARLGRPCPRRVLDRALAYAEELAVVDATELRIVHGDPHPDNLLGVPAPRAGAETGFCFVDPEGFVADRAYDLGVALRDWSGHLSRSTDPRATLRGFSARLAERTGCDPGRIWAWGFLERVSTGLYVLAIGSPTVAAPFLTSAAALL